MRLIVGLTRIVVGACLLVGCSGPTPPPAVLPLSAERDGLALQVHLRATGEALSSRLGFGTIAQSRSTSCPTNVAASPRRC